MGFLKKLLEKKRPDQKKENQLQAAITQKETANNSVLELENTNYAEGSPKAYKLVIDDPSHLSIIVNRNEIEKPSAFNSLELIIIFAAESTVKAGEKPKIKIAINGYDSDPRELYEIADVCNWAKIIVNQVPALCYFLNNDSKLRFAGWVFGPLTKAEINESDFMARLGPELAVCLLRGASQAEKFLKQFGADNYLLEKLRNEDLKEVEKYKLNNKLDKIPKPEEDPTLNLIKELELLRNKFIERWSENVNRIQEPVLKNNINEINRLLLTFQIVCLQHCILNNHLLDSMQWDNFENEVFSKVIPDCTLTSEINLLKKGKKQFGKKSISNYGIAHNEMINITTGNRKSSRKFSIDDKGFNLGFVFIAYLDVETRRKALMYFSDINLFPKEKDYYDKILQAKSFFEIMQIKQ
jgi:hypothetical protein